MIEWTSHMADVAQLVRASVCGTECRRFESGHPPHEFEKRPNGVFFEFTVCCVWVRTGEAAGSKYWTKANGCAPVHRSILRRWMFQHWQSNPVATLYVPGA